VLDTFTPGAPFSQKAMTQRLFGDAPFAADEIERHAAAWPT